MATERVVQQQSLETEKTTEESVNWSLRPSQMREYIGQSELVERLSIAIEAAKHRREPMEHFLLHGPPGLGKTTLAHVVAAEMGRNVVLTSGPALSRGTDLVGALTRLEAGDILFIDEIHRMPIAVEEFIYPAMEDFRIDVPVDSGVHARTVQIDLKPFTLIGATTRAGLVSAPLRSRFGITHHLRFYTQGELLAIIERSAGLLGMEIAGSSGREALATIASRSRGTPRIANRLLRRVRDYVLVRGGGAGVKKGTAKLDIRLVEEALSMEGVDVQGLDELDRQYLRVIATTYGGGPVGVEAVAATLSEESGTLETVVEPYLLQLGYVARMRRGRVLTAAGAKHIGVSLSPGAIEALGGGSGPASGLFEREDAP
jgi:holliday junction DNA helicase RuvB